MKRKALLELARRILKRNLLKICFVAFSVITFLAIFIQLLMLLYSENNLIEIISILLLCSFLFTALIDIVIIAIYWTIALVKSTVSRLRTELEEIEEEQKEH